MHGMIASEMRVLEISLIFVALPSSYESLFCNEELVSLVKYQSCFTPFVALAIPVTD